MRVHGSCLSLLALLALAGCGPGRYYLPAREARRAAEALRGKDEVAVQGVEPDGRQVRLRLRAGDWFTVTHPGYEHEHGGPDMLARVTDSDRVEVEPYNAGRGIFYIGVGLLGGTLLRGVIAAATQGEAMGIVPFAGPIYELHQASELDDGGAYMSLTALSAIGLALQTAGLALMLWGIVEWEPDRGSPLVLRF
jgi:hypothetical protein